MVWLFLFLIVTALFFRAYRNTFHVSTNHVPIVIQSSERVHCNRWMPLRILHLSDLHMENLSVRAERIVEDLQGQTIDLIAITGDLLDREKNMSKAILYIQTGKSVV